VSPRIGKLRHRLVIEAKARTADGGGGAAVAWTEIAEVWGAVEALSGKEAVAAGRVAGTAEYRITLRYRSDVAPAMRLRRGAELFEIVAVLDEDGRRRFLACDCERRDL
jgi:SPP1 family predicted phage head-tail adaptor